MLTHLCRIITVALALVILGASGCHASRPVFDPGSKPADPQGTISGSLEAASSERAIADRTVRAINTESGQRFEARTNPAGGFTLMVPPGKYRLEVDLRDGEKLVDPPAPVDVGAGDVDANVTLTLAPAAQPGGGSDW